MPPPIEQVLDGEESSDPIDNRPNPGIHQQNSNDEQLPIDPSLIIQFGAKQIISLFVPVSICMFLVAIVAKSVPYFSTTDVVLIYTPFNTPNADVGTQTWQTLANVGIFLGVVVAMTFFLVLLFKYKCYKCLNGWLMVTTFILVFFISFIFFTEVLRTTFIFFDNITFALLLWNFGILGFISIHWRAPLIVQQAFLIFNSCQLALIFLKFLPKWTCWVLLGALAIWDLIAVLCPHGPLRMLVEMAHERDRPLLPAMIYSTTSAYLTTTSTSSLHHGNEPLLFTDNRAPKTSTSPELESLIKKPVPSSSGVPCDAGDHDRNSSKKQNIVEIDPAANGIASPTSEYDPTGAVTPPLVANRNHPLAHELTPHENNDQCSNPWRDLQEDLIGRKEQGVKLGLGDFIFYSLLIGRAALDGDMLTIVACYIAILVGMCLTIIALSIKGKALPALPISIACGIIFYFSTASVITPFIGATSQKRIFF